MPKFEVTTDLIVHTKIKVVVEADDKDGAIEAVASLLPNNFDAGVEIQERRDGESQGARIEVLGAAR